jgi:hypothetical protein
VTNTLYFVGVIFAFFTALLPLIALHYWRTFSRLKKVGRAEDRAARAVVCSGGEEGARNVHLVVELEDVSGYPVDLRSRASCSSWAFYDGTPIRVYYDPDDPAQGWIEIDYRRKQKIMLIVTPVFAVVSAGCVLAGWLASSS